MSDKIVVGLSGGVDSSVTAHLLQQQGFEVHGVFMQNWEDDNNDEYCSIKEDSMDAIAVADLLGIDIELVNFAAQYKDRVFSYFLAEYSAGRTPNPDILCNSEIKFKCFLDYAIELGGVKMATGHYAGNRLRPDGRTELIRAADQSKDQTYFLYRLSQQQVSQAVFPLGGLQKSAVREIAEQIKLPNARKKDSTGICFIGERPFREFLNRYLPKIPGKMRTPEGRVVGEHMGLMYYTIGQRQGLGIGGEGLPWFVAGKDMAANELIVVQGHDHPLLLKPTLFARDCSWILGEAPAEGRYTAKTRYRQQDAACTLAYQDDGVLLTFDEAQWAVTPGQSMVLYDGDVCLGGGIIQ
ncbi:tRNA-specific 2-thiouridylase [Andreprevotia lacus DSM 23236]|jgi:tRNA-specific 2-thiouridylase|uniref:tRNA-specific 2-thiouridylase MnmA n=1 Tax=Andreprevotia lacus DSM 23236 TaxID=1121001 RepID=A0A1W1WW62_9NEIS|nr:tRNA 2-thiouridine(34) synthase MnmA [Andreprevotia lacus]SMC15942.1 tRNA-specific 2-thiouridylase [Andreprevotia lacus DSM 23236]